MTAEQKMEARLLKLQPLIKEARRRFAPPGRLEALTKDYKQLHAEWVKAKSQRKLQI